MGKVVTGYCGIRKAGTPLLASPIKSAPRIYPELVEMSRSPKRVDSVAEQNMRISLKVVASGSAGEALSGRGTVWPLTTLNGFW